MCVIARNLDNRMVAVGPVSHLGATGFDRVGLRWEASRGLLAT